MPNSAKFASHSTFLPFIFLAVLLWGCDTYYYMPNTQNVPLHSEQGQARINAGVSINEDSDLHASINASYALGQHLAVMGGISEMSVDLENEGYWLGELGVGYFTPLNKQGWILEIYAGYGIGHSDIVEQNDITSIFTGSYKEVKLERQYSISQVFLQPNIGYAAEDFSGAFSLKMSQVMFGNTSSELFVNGMSLRPGDNGFDQFNSRFYELANAQNQFFLEAALTFRLNIANPFYIQLQGGYAFNLTDMDFPSGNFNLGLMLGVRLGEE